jgi:AcrR family transcriptional regulator
MSSADRRVQLLALARSILREGGLDALTMDALAAKANIGKPVIYRLFENRDALLVALFEVHVADLAQSVDRAIANCGDDLECMITQSARAYFAFAVRPDRSVPRALEGAASNGALGEARRIAADQAAKRWTDRFIERGISPQDASALSMFLLGGLARLTESLARRQISRAEAERVYVKSANAVLKAAR